MQRQIDSRAVEVQSYLLYMHVSWWARVKPWLTLGAWYMVRYDEMKKRYAQAEKWSARLEEMLDLPWDSLFDQSLGSLADLENRLPPTQLQVPGNERRELHLPPRNDLNIIRTERPHSI